MIEIPPDPYISIINDLHLTVQRRCAFCEEVNSNLLTLSDNFSQYSRQLFQLSADTTNTIKKKSNRPENIEPLTNWVHQSLTTSQMTDQFSNMIKLHVTSPLTELSAQYKKEGDSLLLQLQQLSKSHEKDYNEYSKTYKNYIKHCQNIEATFQKNEKNEGKFQLELDTLRGQCYELECAAAAACDKFTNLSLQYQNAVENILFRFEKNESQFFDSYAKLMAKLVNLFGTLENSYKNSHQKAVSDLASIQQRNDKISQNETQDLSSSVGDSFAQTNPLNFNVFDFLPPSIIFQDDLQATYMTAQKSFGIKVLSVNAGDIVKVISQNPVTSTVRIENMSGIRGKVPKNMLAVNKSVKPATYLVKSQHMDGDLQILPGQFVCGILNDGKVVTCKNVLGKIGKVPLEKLQLSEGQ